METARKRLFDDPTRNSHVDILGLPISSRGWTLKTLIDMGFTEVKRISASTNPAKVMKTITHYEMQGLPLIVDGWHETHDWNADMFTPEMLESTAGRSPILARDVYTRQDKPMTISEYIKEAGKTPPFPVPGETERLYGKDVTCPQGWAESLSRLLPEDLQPFGPDDLMTFLPEKDRPETLMCYLGMGDTFTPCHKDLCGSLGHNLMVYTERSSAFWFFVPTEHADAASELFRFKFNQELDFEAHVASLEELQKATDSFPVYVCEQQLGDLVLIPPRSYHQVVNQGGLSIKASWSRMSMQSLRLSLRCELRIYHRICRSETYRVKLTLWHATMRWMRSAHTQEDGALLKELIELLDEVLVEEWTSTRIEAHSTNSQEELPNLVCNCCGADVFQSFFECEQCTDDPASPLVLCPLCYVEGRTCTCVVMTPKQLRPFEELLHARNEAAQFCRTLDSHAPLEMTVNRITNSHHIRIFEAACLLNVDRKKNMPTDGKPAATRSCLHRKPQRSKHTVSILSFLGQCPGCHSGICLQHTLEFMIHPAEALLVFHGKSKTNNKSNWHLYHQDAPTRYERESRKGPLEMELRSVLVWAALTYQTYEFHAIKNLVTPGWFDRYDQSEMPILGVLIGSVEATPPPKKRPRMEGSVIVDLTPRRKKAVPRESSTTSSVSGKLSRKSDTPTMPASLKPTSKPSEPLSRSSPLAPVELSPPPDVVASTNSNSMMRTPSLPPAPTILSQGAVPSTPSASSVHVDVPAAMITPSAQNPPADPSSSLPNPTSALAPIGSSNGTGAPAVPRSSTQGSALNNGAAASLASTTTASALSESPAQLHPAPVATTSSSNANTSVSSLPPVLAPVPAPAPPASVPSAPASMNGTLALTPRSRPLAAGPVASPSLPDALRTLAEASSKERLADKQEWTQRFDRMKQEHDKILNRLLTDFHTRGEDFKKLQEFSRQQIGIMDGIFQQHANTAKAREEKMAAMFGHHMREAEEREKRAAERAERAEQYLASAEAHWRQAFKEATDSFQQAMRTITETLVSRGRGRGGLLNPESSIPHSPFRGRGTLLPRTSQRLSNPTFNHPSTSLSGGTRHHFEHDPSANGFYDESPFVPANDAARLEGMNATDTTLSGDGGSAFVDSVLQSDTMFQQIHPAGDTVAEDTSTGAEPPEAFENPASHSAHSPAAVPSNEDNATNEQFRDPQPEPIHQGPNNEAEPTACNEAPASLAPAPVPADSPMAAGDDEPDDVDDDSSEGKMEEHQKTLVSDPNPWAIVVDE